VTPSEGLEEIGEESLYCCTLLEEITIPNNVRAIESWAFHDCTRLTRVTLGNGLEEIGSGAFMCCASIEEIIIPNSVRVIMDGAFYDCSVLTSVTLGDGLEEIGERAFKNCTLIEHILIPPTVKTIGDTTFKGCSNLMHVEFCPQIDEFVSNEAMRNWWNQGVHERCLTMYCFYVRCSIPERLDLVRVGSWRANIYDMLRRIPTICAEGLHSVFASIDFRTYLYEVLKDLPSMLELVLGSRQSSVDSVRAIPSSPPR
jgi:hypothetical protein